jgi:serine/threonine-protein kinase SRPK3
VLREMMFTLGKFPDQWWSRWEKRSDYLVEDGTFTGDKRTVGLNLKSHLQYLSALSEPDEVAAFEKMLRAMLRLEPKERVSADEVVRMLLSA